jgi:hypothetical protein
MLLIPVRLSHLVLMAVTERGQISDDRRAWHVAAGETWEVIAMKVAGLCLSVRPPVFRTSLAVTLLLSGVVGTTGAFADEDDINFRPGNLLVSRSVYDNNPANVVAGTTLLPPNCVAPNCVTATDGGAYPFVFNNSLVDGSFGITAKILLDQLEPSGKFINSLEVALHDSDRRDQPTGNQVLTSFPSKSEIALNLSTDGRVVTFMGYLAPLNALDVSNSNTPAVVDPTNPVPGSFSRLVAEVDAQGHFHFTKTNAYSGNNGRAAILNEKANVFYMTGNAGNGANPQPNGVIIGAGAQIATPVRAPLNAQPDPGMPTPVGSFNITQLGLKADKIGKDTNFRGLTVANNVIYTTKGSGGNGINTVYFIDTTGFDANGKPLACPSGVGLPGVTAALPTSPIVYDATKLQTLGVTPYNMCILKGFTTTLAKATTTSFPFGVWFANATTLYVTDEGNGTTTFDPASGKFTAAAAQTTAGLQKWVFDSGLGAWKLAYVLQAGLNLGIPYTIDHYPTGQNPRTNLPWAPAADGLRNLTGRVNRDGTATIWAITSTVSGSGDQGADPNQMVMITDQLAATSAPAGESFKVVRTAGFAEVLRGVSFTPGTDRDQFADAGDHRGDADRDH